MAESAMYVGKAFTRTEKAVLDQLVCGSSNKAIARELACSVKTVEFHVTNLLKKSGVASRLELVVTALRWMREPTTR